MRCDIVLSGVGGQGVLSVAALIAQAALRDGFQVKQSETHGMAQRGGAVTAQLRIADGPIWSDLVPLGSADLILSMEPIEGFRYLRYLAPRGTLVTASEPVVNIPDYPPIEEVREHVRRIDRSVLVDADKLAKEAGLARAANVVLVGAASHVLPVRPETLEAVIREGFAAKGPQVVEANLRAFRSGREASKCVPC
jgi:indolepyruvate ferredoxin oxidoreductase beta subunit